MERRLQAGSGGCEWERVDILSREGSDPMECSSAAWKGGGEKVYNHYYILRAVF